MLRPGARLHDKVKGYGRVWDVRDGQAKVTWDRNHKYDGWYDVDRLHLADDPLGPDPINEDNAEGGNE